MVEENSDDVTIKMGFGTISVDATIDNLEEVLAPIFRDLDEVQEAVSTVQRTLQLVLIAQGSLQLAR